MQIFCQNANYCQQRSGKLKKHNWIYHVSILIHPSNHLEKSIHQFWQIHLTTLRNPCNNSEKSNLNKIQLEQWWTFRDKARQWSTLGQYNNEIWSDRRFDLQLQILLRCMCHWGEMYFLAFVTSWEENLHLYSFTFHVKFTFHFKQQL